MFFTKYDSGKPSFTLLADLYPELGDVERVLQFGARKYSTRNWMLASSQTDLDRYCNAALRHIFEHLKGNRCDDESGLQHLAHAVTNLLFVLNLSKGSIQE